MRQRYQTGLALAGSLLLLSLLGCASASALWPSSPQSPLQTAQRMTQPTQPVDARLLTANTRFGFKLFSEVLKQNPGQNVTISPSSVAIALSMTYNGASGETKQAMARALELQGLTLQEINQGNAALEAALENADPKVKLAIANSLWGRQDFQFRPEFLQQNRQFYNAEIATLDFGSADAVRTINNWVSQRTEGKIPSIVDQLEPDDVLYLINAIYFKGNWTTQFDPGNTAPRPFFKLNETQEQHPFMSQTGNYLYAETEQFQAISLPYGDRRLSMVLLLPKADSSLAELQQNLTPENWQRWMQQMRSREGSIQLPKFKQEFSIGLNDTLKTLGMGVAFDRNRADFGGISTEQTYINKVQHKTFIEVNEEGTEAAAATSVGIGVTSVQLDGPFQMVCDRPFFYAIRDNQTGTLLFMGTMVDPQL